MNIIDELRREFPGWTFTLDKRGDPKAWKGPREPLEAETSQYALVKRSSSGGFNGYPLRGGSVKFSALLEAAEYALGEKAESTKAREGAAIKADEPREYDNGDPETEADKASFAEFARLAPFRNAWPEWEWSSPNEWTYNGELDGHRWRCIQTHDGASQWFSVCTRFPDWFTSSDAFGAMRLLMAYIEPEKTDPPSTQVRPAHYGGTGNPYECIKVIRAWGLNFELGNVAKYLSRAGKKPGVEAVDDLRKLITYAQMEIERLEEANGN